jgi:hypothetical protein
MIEPGEIWTIEGGKKYVVASIIDLDNKKYVYLINKEDYKQYMIGEYQGEELEEVENPDLLETLIVKFNEDLKENLPKYISEYL